MHQSINRKKIYFYLLILLFLSTSFNFNLLKGFREISIINKININGLDKHEEKLVKEKLEIILNANSFFLNKKIILKNLNQFNFLDSVTVQKILPSEINVNLIKTTFTGRTIIDGEKYYIGKNGKFTNAKLVNNKDNLPLVFGKFEAKDFLKLQNILKKKKINLDKINKYFYYRNKRWDIQNKDGLTVMLPSKNLNESIDIYKKLIESIDLNTIKIVDLRIPKQIILTSEKK